MQNKIEEIKKIFNKVLKVKKILKKQLSKIVKTGTL